MADLNKYFDKKFLTTKDSDSEDDELGEDATVEKELELTVAKLTTDQKQAVLDYAKGLAQEVAEQRKNKENQADTVNGQKRQGTESIEDQNEGNSAKMKK
jgi:hypothetical protein